MGIKTGNILRAINLLIAYILVCSMHPREDQAALWADLGNLIDTAPFEEVMSWYEQNFIAEDGQYAAELTFHDHLQEKFFRVATPALEGYQYRLKQLMKTYNISNKETLVDKVLNSEERHFSSKVTEVLIGRIIPPDLPEKFFFERSMGPLPISTAIADIYGEMGQHDVKTIARMIVDQSENLALPQRRYQASLCDLESYKKSLISMDAFHPEILDKHKERLNKVKEARALKEEQEDLPSNNGSGLIEQVI